MADKFKFYEICPSCHGTGFLQPHDEEDLLGDRCNTCLDESGAFGAKVFDGVRHVYAGRFEEIEE